MKLREKLFGINKKKEETTRILTLQVTYINNDISEEELKKRLDADDVKIVREKIFVLDK